MDRVALTAAPSRRLRVLMVTGAYHPEISASGVQCRSVARLLVGRAEVRVLTTAINPALRAEEFVDGVEVFRIVVDVDSPLSKARAALMMTITLLRVMRRCDVVHLHGFSSKNVLITAVAGLLGRPIVMSLHTAGFDEASAIRQQGRAAWWAFGRADRYLSVSPGLAASYHAAGLPADRLELVPNGIDTTRFAPATIEQSRQLRRRLSLPVDRPIIMFVGFFSRDKQPRLLFDAWRQLREAQGIESTLIFVGATKSTYFEVDDDLVERMRQDAGAAGLGKDVLFVGATDRVEDYLRAADLFALPSRREGLPVALLEAMACGLPCVASHLTGSTDGIVDHGINGLLAASADEGAWARELAIVLRDPRLAQTLGTAARQTIVERYSSPDIANRWLRAYQAVSQGTFEDHC